MLVVKGWTERERIRVSLFSMQCVQLLHCRVPEEASRWLLRHKAVQLDDALAQERSGGAAFGCSQESPGGGEGATEARRGREREDDVRFPAAALQCVRRGCSTMLRAAV